MILYNLKTAFRFLYKNKVFAGINAVGLSIALTVSFIILLYVINEYSYDRFHKNSKRIYRVLSHDEDFKSTRAHTPYVMASTIKEEFSQVEAAINIRRVSNFKLKIKDELISIDNALATGSDIFDIFTLPFITGTENKQILEGQNSLVLSKDLADKFFPDENPVGAAITGIVNGEEHTFIITGVFENIPVNSTLKAQCFLNSKWPVEDVNRSYGVTNAEEAWSYYHWNTWVKLSEGSNAESVENQFRSLEAKYIPEHLHHSFSLQKLSDVYLRSDNVQNNGISGNMKNVKLFSLIAFLIVLVAAGNYIILSTAVSSIRAREIGIRKTYGGTEGNIRKQMLNEAVLLIVFTFSVALFLARISIPYAEKLFNKELPIINNNIITYISIYVILTIIIGVTSGLYTSAYLSRLKVLDIVKNINYTGKRKVLLRSSLIVTQLVIFCSFIACLMVILSQYNYALRSDTGFYKQNILQIEAGRDFTGYSTYISSIRSNPDIIVASGSFEGLPNTGGTALMFPHYQDNERKMIETEIMNVDYGFIETMGIEIIKGRDFSREFGNDMGKTCILNESAVRQFGIINPVGSMLAGNTIIGVVKDFNLHSIHTHIPPLLISLTDNNIQSIVVRYQPGTLNTVLPMVETEWKKIAGDRPFIYSTIEDIFKDLYTSEKTLAAIVTLASVFTILIAIIGLFGLTLFVATTRTKEIGIKKVLGSSEWAILFSLLYENIILVVIATVLSVPVTIYFMTKWLNNYPYRVNIEWWVFIIGFAVAGLVVILTVYFHSWKVARTNPVEALRYE